MDTTSNGFLRGLFSDDNQPSIENIISVGVMIAASGWITYIVVKTHALPEAGSLASLTGFCAVHHMANKVSSAFGGK